MVSLAAGLAHEGHLPWVYSIAPFVAFRPYEQIRTDVCLHKLPVKLVGNGGGYGYGIMGATHHALEDVGAMRVLPNMRLYVPLTAADVPQVVEPDGAGSAAELLAAQHRRRDSRRGSAVRAVAEDQARTKLRRRSEWGRWWATCTRWATRPCSTTSRSGAWGCFPSTTLPADLIASIEEKQRVVTIEEHYRACGLAEAVSYLLLRQRRVPALVHQPSRERISRADVTAASAGTRKRAGSRVERCARSWSGSFVADARPPRLSAVIACYKDAQAIPLMYERLSAVFVASGRRPRDHLRQRRQPGRHRVGVEGADGQGRPCAGHRALEELRLAERLSERNGARHRRRGGSSRRRSPGSARGHPRPVREVAGGERRRLRPSLQARDVGNHGAWPTRPSTGSSGGRLTFPCRSTRATFR